MTLRKTLMTSLLALTIFASCSKDDDTVPENACFADQFELNETKVENYAETNSAIITFDATNKSGTTYNIQNGASLINVKIEVTTTDGSKYETNQPLTITELSAGATASTTFIAEYGAGKTYKSYRVVSVTCAN